MKQVHVAKSIKEYSNEILDFQKGFPLNTVYIDGRNKKNLFLYRGQKKNYGSTKYLASLFRQQKDEYLLTSTYMHMCDLSNLDSNFSRLSYMQHFGLPTRLLDLTREKFVALYFACQPDENGCFDKDDGIVDIYCSNTKQNDYDYFSPNVYSDYSYNDDIVKLASTLALMTENDKTYIYNKIHEFEKFVTDSFSSIALNEKDINFYISNYYYLFCQFKRRCMEDHSTHPFEYYMSDAIKAGIFISADIIRKSYNDSTIDSNAYIRETDKKGVDVFTNVNNAYDKLYGSPEIQSLLTDINKETSLKDPLIDFVALLRPFFVKPNIDNSRIEAQKGYFLFEPYKESENVTITDINEDIKKRFAFEDYSITIPANRKKTIFKDLDSSCHINRATLFPDSENIAKYISRGY
ncbi:FRG domain-containing protein [Lactobacillus mellis]|uniref:FRG domain-containing protein n=1 Tax=Bombilactobacillus mellis TaxID=1218508 RepID=UPI00157FE8DA|nr:FRG domain-containing protein [Bombilactobacillus mellis]NUG39759.1 FRG domain-containing protein [Bombilactobacillus mellis]